MKKFIKRQVLNLFKIRIESGMSGLQLTRDINEKTNYEIYTLPNYLPILTLYLNTQDGNWKDRMIKISDRSIARFNLCIRKVIEWFYDPDKKDMFLYDENGDLVFNHSFKDLNEVYYDPFEPNKFLKIIPSTVSGKDNKVVEGVSMYINQLDTIVSVSRYDLEDLMTLMSNFSFQEEAILLMSAINIAANNPDTIIDGSFYIAQKKEDASLRAVPLTPDFTMQKKRNIFGV